MNYNFPSKRHWRRSLWNCIAERLQVPRRNAVVLYLAGAADEDRAVALQKGFVDHNLIAMEKDAAAAKQLRQGGALTLIGDAFDHLIAWPADRPVHALHLDLCGGLKDRLFEQVAALLVMPQFQGCVVAINMLRGRDPSGNQIRARTVRSIQAAVQYELSGPAHQDRLVKLKLATAEGLSARLAQHLGAGDLKHRGVLLQHFIRERWALLCAVAAGLLDEQGREKDLSSATSRTQCLDRFYAIESAARPQTLSYRSVAHQTFDTLVFVNALAAGQVWALPTSDLLHGEPGQVGADRRQQAAIWAHRTRRIKERA